MLTTHHGTAESDRMHAPPLSVTTRPEPLVTLKKGAQLQLLFFVDPARRAAHPSARFRFRVYPHPLSLNLCCTLCLTPRTARCAIFQGVTLRRGAGVASLVSQQL